MDIHHHQKLINSSWEPSMPMSMENHIIHEPINPMETFWPNFVAFGNHQNPSSSTCQIPDGSGHVRHEQIVNQHQQQMVGGEEDDEEEEDQEEEAEEELGAMKEMMFKIAAMQPVDIDPATIRKPKRRNVRISDDPQSVAARHRRERISEKIRILQRLVPGGTKMDTASMLDEAIRYVKFLKRQIRQLQANQQPSLAAPPSSTWTLTKGTLSSTTIATTVTTTTNTATATAAAASSYSVGANRLCCSDQPICFSNEVIRD